jgi:hypothetical protein
MIQHRVIQHRPVPPLPSNGAAPRFEPPPPPRHPVAAIPGPRPAPDFGAAPAGLLPYPGPPVPEIRIRPRLLWVGLSWLLFGVLVLAGVTMFVAESTGTGPKSFFAGGEVATLELDPAADPLIYAELDAGGYVRCEPVGPGADALDLAPVADDWSVLVGGREWHAAFELAPAVAGTYQIVCDGPGASFAFGDDADTAAGGAAVALIALPLVGFGTAATTTIIVLNRRRAEQDRLFAPWTGQRW